MIGDLDILKFFRKKDRKLGVAEGKRLYDLPLEKSEGSRFLILLIALMSFLAVMAAASSFALSAMTERWTSGLENKLTIEIPAENEKGKILTSAEIQSATDRVAKSINTHQAVKSAEVLGKKEIQDLVSPWLGEDIALADIPLPGLVSVELHLASPETLAALQKKAERIVPNAQLDTHEDWLNDLLRFTGAMQFSAVLITLIIGVTTIIAVAGAIRSRMAVHKAEVELLHLMGAKDGYITRQFQRHALTLTLQGSLIGVVIGGLVMLVIGLISGDTAAALLPDFHLSIPQILALCLLPALACLISTMTARYTVLRALAQMP